MIRNAKCTSVGFQRLKKKKKKNGGVWGLPYTTDPVGTSPVLKETLKRHNNKEDF